MSELDPDACSLRAELLVIKAEIMKGEPEQ